MTVNVCINGFGIMGRYLVRALYNEIGSGERDPESIRIVAFNDLYPSEALAPLLGFSSDHGWFPGEVRADGDDIIVDEERIRGHSFANPTQLAEIDCNLIYDGSGVWTKPNRKPELEETRQRYLDDRAGGKKILFSAPSPSAEVTIVAGVNDDDYTGQDIVSAASCTTNDLAPLGAALFDGFGNFTGLMTTIHAYTGDQNIVDAPHKDLARAYSAGVNFTPTTTGAAAAIGQVIKELDENLDGIAIRGPIGVGSIVDLTAQFDRDVTSDEVNEVLRTMAEGRYARTLEFREGPMVSRMVIGHPVPSVVDGSKTKTISNLAKVISFYDNVAGFSHQALRVIDIMSDES